MRLWYFWGISVKSRSEYMAGDIVLYSRNQLVVFFGSNSWSYTKLGHISGLSADELTVLLDKKQTVIELQLKSK